ncbi:MAG: helix-turn-helix domain-containing protein [Deinococcota bacterium]
MNDVIQLNTISELHAFLGFEKPKHPLVSVTRFSQDQFPAAAFDEQRYALGLYTVGLKEGRVGSYSYGRNTYDFHEGTMVFMAPGQTMQDVVLSEVLPVETESWILMFHPDLIRRSDLGDKIDSYTFFNYEIHEALHLSEDEKASATDIIHKIEQEYSQNIDRHSQDLIVSNIKLLLDYCTRYFDRQFHMRSNLNQDIVTKFEQFLKGYYNSDKPEELGVPSVAYCGEALNMSPYYLSDLLKKETGRSAQDHIHFFVVEKAKTKLLNSNDSVSSIAYDLGFEYPQHFSKVFKTKTGLSPRDYRSMN